MLRFLLNLLSPPAIATGLLTIGTWIIGDYPPEARTVVVVLCYAYFFAGIPSLIHACVLACAYRLDWSPLDGRAILLSTVNGLLAGVPLGWLIADGQAERLFSPTVGIFAALGAATGAINGLLQFLIREKPAR